MSAEIAASIRSEIDRLKKEIEDLEERKKRTKARLRRKEKMLKLALVDDRQGE